VKRGQDQYKYDPNGNLVQKTGNGGTFRYHYDADQNLTGVDLPGGRQYRYQYNALGERISKTGPEGSTYFLHDREDVLAEYDTHKKRQRLYLHGPGFDDLAGVIADQSVYAVHSDALDSIVALTDGEAQVRSRYLYSAFGQVQVQKEALPLGYLYTGARYDAESNLHYLRTRGYDPTIGRFISPDKIDIAGGINLYAYVENNPVNYNDPRGFVGPIVLVGGVAALIAIDINNRINPKYDITLGASTGGQFAVGAGYKGGLNVQYFGLDRRTDLYSFLGAAFGSGVAAGPSLNIAIVGKGKEWKGEFNSADLTVGSFSGSIFTNEDLSAIGIEISPVKPSLGAAGHLTRTWYTPLVVNPLIDWLTGKPQPPPFDTDACLKDVRELLAKAREAADSGKKHFNQAKKNIADSQSILDSVSKTINSARQKVAAIDAVLHSCASLPTPFDTGSELESANSATAAALEILTHAVSHSTEACRMVQSAKNAPNQKAREIYRREAEFLKNAIQEKKIENLEELITKAKADLQGSEGMGMQHDSQAAIAEAQAKLTDLSITAKDLNNDNDQLTKVKSDIQNVQQLLETAGTEASNAYSLINMAYNAIARCPQAALEKEILNERAQIEALISSIPNNQLSTIQSKHSRLAPEIVNLIAVVEQKKSSLQNCATLTFEDKNITAAKAALSKAEGYLVQAKVEWKTAKSCVNAIANLSPLPKKNGKCVTDDQCNTGHVCRQGQCKPPSFDPGLIDGYVQNESTRTKGQTDQVTTDQAANTTRGGFTKDGLDRDMTDIQEDMSAQCSDRRPCPAGQNCENGQCVGAHPTSECSDRTPCPAGHTCQNGQCVDAQPSPECSDKNPCPSGQTCQNGQCVKAQTPSGCNDKSDCGPNEECKNNKCTPKPSKTDCRKQGCPGGYTCNTKTGKCIRRSNPPVRPTVKPPVRPPRSNRQYYIVKKTASGIYHWRNYRCTFTEYDVISCINKAECNNSLRTIQQGWHNRNQKCKPKGCNVSVGYPRYWMPQTWSARITKGPFNKEPSNPKDEEKCTGTMTY
jgi:RHS repeat-associated protein